MATTRAVRNVLIADDDASIRKLVGTLLSEEGYVVREAVDGVEAVDALRRSPTRLVVLLDLKMPRMSGLEVLDLLDTSAELARHAYIVLTASPSVLDAEHTALLARNSIPLMLKTARVNELLEAVARAASRLA